jgi:tetratricopeptide (TPR) repeat protein
MKASFFAVLLLLVPQAAFAAAQSFVSEKGLSEEQRYQRCIDLAHGDADNAHAEATTWFDVGGGVPALHCAAIALFLGKHYTEAALKFDQLARARDAGSSTLRGEILDQAGNAWLMAGEGEKAETSISGALNLGDRTTDVYADRARARAMRKDWPGAESDLNVALAKDAFRTDLLVLRASAREALGRASDARTDLDQALQIDPGYADALVERGTLRFETGDADGARADWERVISAEPKSAAADAARARLAELAAIAQPPAKHQPTPH